MYRHSSCFKSLIVSVSFPFPSLAIVPSSEVFDIVILSTIFPHYIRTRHGLNYETRYHQELTNFFTVTVIALVYLSEGKGDAFFLFPQGTHTN